MQPLSTDWASLLSGVKEGAEQDQSEAVRWYRQAALHGSASAQAAMGAMFQSGVSVGGTSIAKDTGEAIRWYHLADAQNTVVATSQLNTLEAESTPSAEDSGEY
jgi:uncharacterized protein